MQSAAAFLQPLRIFDLRPAQLTIGKLVFFALKVNHVGFRRRSLESETDYQQASIHRIGLDWIGRRRGGEENKKHLRRQQNRRLNGNENRIECDKARSKV